MTEEDRELIADLLSATTGILIREFSRGKSEWTEERTEDLHNHMQAVIDTYLEIERR